MKTNIQVSDNIQDSSSEFQMRPPPPIISQEQGTFWSELSEDVSSFNPPIILRIFMRLAKRYPVLKKWQNVPELRHPAKDKLTTFAGFNEGWNLGEGEKFSHEVIKQVLGLIDECLKNNFFEIDVFPGLDGDVRLAIYKAPDYYEFTVGDTVTYCHEKNDVEEEYHTGLTIVDARSRILSIKGKVWNSFAYSIHSGSTRIANVFKVQQLNPQNPYLYLISSAQ